MIRFHTGKTAWLLANGLPGVLLAPWALGWDTALVGASLGFGTFLVGHTVALHRCVIHEALRLPRGLRDGMLVGFVLTGLGGPLAWIRAHNQRDHWQNQPTAPAWFRTDHAMARDALWNLTTVFDEPVEYVPEPHRSDPWLGLLQRTWVGWNLALFAILFAVGGWRHLVIAGFLRVFLSLVLHWGVGWEAHARGELRYPVPGAVESGRNRWLLGALSLGEGHHNNHHAFPGSARIGHAPWEIDVGWWLVLALEGLDLATEVRRPEDVVGRAGPLRSTAGYSAPEAPCAPRPFPTARAATPSISSSPAPMGPDRALPSR